MRTQRERGGGGVREGEREGVREVEDREREGGVREGEREEGREKTDRERGGE